MDVYKNLKEHAIELPKQLAAAGLYRPVNQAGNLLFVSGQGSMVNGEKITGLVGSELDMEAGQAAARVCAINTLSALEAHLGDLNKIKRCVKILGFVSSTNDFHDQAQVINGASQVFMDAFGDEGRHARSAVGLNTLPLGLAVEVESIFEIEED